LNARRQYAVGYVHGDSSAFVEVDLQAGGVGELVQQQF
jgi:hypothetical protein